MPSTTVWWSIADTNEETWDINVECQVSDHQVQDWKITYVERGCPVPDHEIQAYVTSCLDVIEAAALENIYD